MTWKSVTFERNALYEEIWREPMTVVAKRHGLSDVGLRKICVKLDIPIPPRGHWAKMAAGHAVKKIPLFKPEESRSVVRSMYVAPHDEKLEQRLTNARETTPEPVVDSSNYSRPSDIFGLGREATQLNKATAKLKEEEGLISLTERAWADIRVSQNARDRALYVLDQLAFAVKAVNSAFQLKPIPTIRPLYRNERKEPPYDRGYFEIHDEKYFVRIKEKIITEEIIELPPPASKRAATRRWEPNPIFRPKKFTYHPTGIFHLFVYTVGSTYETAKIEDTTVSSLESRLFNFVQRLEAKSLRSKLEVQIRVEKKREYEQKTQIWEERKSLKSTLLQKLKSFESMAQELDRAESLRRLIQRIEISGEAPQSLKSDLHLLAIMADWLDPLTAKRWPEVDDVPDHNPHSWW